MIKTKADMKRYIQQDMHMNGLKTGGGKNIYKSKALVHGELEAL